ncbi:hypothetical protein [Streptomyces sp. GQFP]|nr:hypothetical protein [Streptomyces sp. GQFP]UIX33889.1 hypothetical protein LUX31_29980 [Streptomyces sp. GQFP]
MNAGSRRGGSASGQRRFRRRAEATVRARTGPSTPGTIRPTPEEGPL